MSYRISTAKAGSAKPIVVKLGGSLAKSGRLSSILDIVGRARVPVVIVPGGGVFADAVRRAQAEFGFSDLAAHRMALLAMHQSGLMLGALHARLAPVETLAELRRVLARDQIPVWLPLKLAMGDKCIPANWSVTSDGLAARLAERLGRAPVVLVKSRPIKSGTSLTALSRAAVVDPTFAVIVERARLDWRVLGSGEEQELAALIDAGPKTINGRLSNPGNAGRRMAPARAIARPR